MIISLVCEWINGGLLARAADKTQRTRRAASSIIKMESSHQTPPPIVRSDVPAERSHTTAGHATVRTGTTHLRIMGVGSRLRAHRYRTDWRNPWSLIQTIRRPARYRDLDAAGPMSRSAICASGHSFGQSRPRCGLARHHKALSAWLSSARPFGPPSVWFVSDRRGWRLKINGRMAGRHTDKPRRPVAMISPPHEAVNPPGMSDDDSLVEVFAREYNPPHRLTDLSGQFAGRGEAKSLSGKSSNIGDMEILLFDPLNAGDRPVPKTCPALGETRQIKSTSGP